MTDPDGLVRMLSVIGAASGVGGLVVSMLTYRRGRSRVFFDQVTFKIPTVWDDDPVKPQWIFYANLINRSQVKVFLLEVSDVEESGVTLEFMPSSRRWYQWRVAGRGSISYRHPQVQRNGPPLTIEPFNGTPIQSSFPLTGHVGFNLPDSARMRFKVTLSTGKPVYSRWVQLPTLPPELKAKTLKHGS